MQGIATSSNTAKYTTYPKIKVIPTVLLTTGSIPLSKTPIQNGTMNIKNIIFITAKIPEIKPSSVVRISFLRHAYSCLIKSQK